jgi:uncharacterized protein (TIGR02217 family)
MGNSIFPATSLKGLDWDVIKSPIFNVMTQTSVDLKSEVRTLLSSNVQYKVLCNFEFLRQDAARSLAEKDTLEGFFKARFGSFDSFLLKLTDLTQDPADSAITGGPAGTADGATTTFQLQKSVGGFIENVDAVSASGFNLYCNGILRNSAQYTLNANSGTVTFNAVAATITNVSLTSNVVTVTCTNTFSVGQQVAFAGLTTATFLNGQTVTIATVSGTQFTAAFTHANATSHSDTGTATGVAAPIAGVVVTFDAATFYYRVRFELNTYDFDLFQYRLWSLQSLTMLTVNS